MKKSVQFIFFVIAIIAGGIVLFGELDSFIPIRVSVTFGFLGFLLEIKNKGELAIITLFLILALWCYFYTCHAKDVRNKLDKTIVEKSRIQTFDEFKKEYELNKFSNQHPLLFETDKNGRTVVSIINVDKK